MISGVKTACNKSFNHAVGFYWTIFDGDALIEQWGYASSK